MATKPDKFPEWANDNPVDPVSGQSARVAPPQSKKDSGWSREEVPPRQWFNWLSWKTNQWILWLEESVDDLLSRMTTVEDKVEARTETLDVDASGSGNIDLTGTRARFIRLTGARTANGELTFDDDARSYWILNETTGGFDLNAVTETGSTPITIQFKNTQLRSDGSEMIEPRANLAVAVAELPEGNAAFDYTFIDASSTGSEFRAVIELSNGDVIAGGAYSGAAGSPVFKSEDSGDTWSAVGASFFGDGDFINDLIVLENGTILAATNDKIAESTDGGENWSNNTTDFGGWRIYQSDNDDVYVIVSEAVYRSTNNGDTWSDISPDPGSLPGGSARAILRTEGGSLLFVGGQGVILRSTDNGSTWSSIDVSDDIGNTTLRCLYQDSSSQGVIASGSSQSGASVLRSEDDGETWTLVVSPDNSMTTIARCLRVGFDRTLYFGIAGRAVAYALNTGDRWRFLSEPSFSRLYGATILSDGRILAVGTGLNNEAIAVRIESISQQNAIPLGDIIDALEW